MPPVAEPPVGSTSVRMGAAFLRPSAEHRGHYELMRHVITVQNEGDRVTKTQHPEPIGPLAVYRLKRHGDRISTSEPQFLVGPPMEMRSMDSKGQPLDLILVWHPQMEKQ